MDNRGNGGYYPFHHASGSPDGNYTGNFRGTSAACPHAAGVAALMLSANPGLKPYETEWILKLSATDIPPSGYDTETGYYTFPPV